MPTTPTNSQARLKLQKQLDELCNKSAHYRYKYASKAKHVSLMNKIMHLIAILASVVIFVNATGVIPELFHAVFSPRVTLYASLLVALSLILANWLYSPNEYVKLFYAAGQFFNISQDAYSLMNDDSLTTDVLREEYDLLSNDYFKIKSIYVQYIESPKSYYWQHKTVAAPGKQSKHLPPLTGKIARFFDKAKDNQNLGRRE